MSDLSSFLSNAPTSSHAVKELSYQLCLKNFEPLEESTSWELEKMGKYFVAREGSLASFILPKKCPKQLLLLASHTDSPGFKLKPQSSIQKSEMQFLSVEPYGSPIIHSWTSRDLAIAGKIFVRAKNGSVESHLIFLDDHPCIIPELPIHLQRDVNEKGPLLNLEEQFLPLLSLTSFQLESLLKKILSFEKLLSFDLFLVPIDPPRFLGPSNALLSSYRLDNLSSVFATLSAFDVYQDSETLPIGLFFDHEEIGSNSFCGASSSFANDLLTRIRLFYGLSEEQFLALKANSFCISIDVTHGFLPTHSTKYSDQHRAFLGKGIAIKSHAKLSYASTAKTIAKTRLIAEEAAISLQEFANRSDMPSGSTIGPSLASTLGIETVDIGIPLLSMHSAREVIAIQDYLDLVKFLKTALLSQRM